MERRKLALRLALSGVALVAFFVLLNGYLGSSATASISNVAAEQSELPFEERDQIAQPTDNVTVMTGQGFGGSEGYALIALAPDGRLLYYENRYDSYFDVDPSPSGKMTVLTTGATEINSSACGVEAPASRPFSAPGCVRDSIVQINLSTGQREVLHTFVAPATVHKKIHDVDRLGEHRLLVAGMAYDRVYVLNTTTGIIEWQWEAQQNYNLSGGGPYPSDWTHVNDVERLPDGRYMASLRNQDQVVFVDPETGFDGDWTLGSEDDYEILNEQHNPDYIPREQGGPAVIVADSHNDRIVEYQRTDGEWVQSWVWEDDELQWPRDADRLPNGNTLIVDSNGNRLVEVNRSGDIVWEVSADTLYDAERLGTGDESAGGPSARRGNLTNRTLSAGGGGGGSLLAPVKDTLRAVVSPKLRNTIAFILPSWMWWTELFAVALLVGALLTLGIFEYRWSSVRLDIRAPVRLRRE